MNMPFIKKIQYINKYRYARQNDSGAHIKVSVGEHVSKDTIIASGNISKMVYKIKLTDVFSNIQKIEKYICRVDGELVLKGDSLIQKGSFNLSSPVEGIVDFSSLNNGIILIKSFPEDVTVTSMIDGDIVDVFEDKIITETSVARVNLSMVLGDSVESQFKYIADERGYMDIDNINASCTNKIIYVGGYITREAIKKSVAVGASGIIGNGIEIFDNENIEDLINTSSISIGIIDGFGKIYDTAVNELKNFDGKLSLIEQDSSAFVIPCGNVTEDIKSSFIRSPKINDNVQIFSFPVWGQTGVISNINYSNNMLTVTLSSGNDVDVHLFDVIGII